MKKDAIFRWFGIAFFCIAGIAEAPATQLLGERPVDAVLRIQAEQERHLAAAPRLREIDAVIRSDCAARNPRVTRDSSYCHCAAATMMHDWKSGVDRVMLQRILDFSIGRGRATAQSFVAYQRPELYQSFCSPVAP